MTVLEVAVCTCCKYAFLERILVHDCKINLLNWNLLLGMCVCWCSWKHLRDKSHLKMKLWWPLLSSPPHSNQAVTVGPCLIKEYLQHLLKYMELLPHMSPCKKNHITAATINIWFSEQWKVKATDHNDFLICVGYLSQNNSFCQLLYYRV